MPKTEDPNEVVLTKNVGDVENCSAVTETNNNNKQPVIMTSGTGDETCLADDASKASDKTDPMEIDELRIIAGQNKVTDDPQTNTKVRLHFVDSLTLFFFALGNK
ncbi:unnamed protein product [Trichobilharzia regenti]|nr:unnamed protein product [Trichobilharzia regenti]